MQAMIFENSPDGWWPPSAPCERLDSTSLLGEIGVPTLVVGGEEDGISSPRSWAPWPRRYQAPIM